MIGSGWVNNCGKELFTLGWVTCVAVVEKKDGSGGARSKEIKGYNLTAAQIDQMKREDEELVAIIMVIGEHLL